MVKKVKSDKKLYKTEQVLQILHFMSLFFPCTHTQPY